MPGRPDVPVRPGPAGPNIRIAPSFPSVEGVEQAAEGIALCTLLAASEKVLSREGIGDRGSIPYPQDPLPFV